MTYTIQVMEHFCFLVCYSRSRAIPRELAGDCGRGMTDPARETEQFFPLGNYQWISSAILLVQRIRFFTAKTCNFKISNKPPYIFIIYGRVHFYYVHFYISFLWSFKTPKILYTGKCQQYNLFFK